MLFLSINHPLVVNLIAQRLHSGPISTQLRSYAGHSSPAKTVKHDVSGLRVMEYVAHNGLMRDLCVIRVGIVNGIIFSLAHIRSERFSTVRLFWIIWSAIMLKEVVYKWIWTCCIVRRI